MLVVVVVVLVAWVAAAWADWSAPVTVTLMHPHRFVTGLAVASGPAGDMLAWSTQAETNQPWAGYGAVAPPGGNFGSEQRLPGSGS